MAYEIPATLQYVHDQTGQKLHYVGHSLVKIFINHEFLFYFIFFGFFANLFCFITFCFLC